MGHMHYFLRNLRHPIWKAGLVSIHSPSEKAHSRKLVVASPATNIPFYGAQSSVTP